MKDLGMSQNQLRWFSWQVGFLVLMVGTIAVGAGDFAWIPGLASGYCWGRGWEA